MNAATVMVVEPKMIQIKGESVTLVCHHVHRNSVVNTAVLAREIPS